MQTSDQHPSTHPLTTVVGLLREQVKSVGDLEPVFMVTRDKADVLGELVALESQVAELRLRVMVAAGDVAEMSGDRSVASWLARTQRLRRGDCAADARLADALDRDLPVLSHALREVAVNLDQARVIAHAVGELPDSVGREVVALAEAELVRLAAVHAPKELAVLGRRILEIVDPQRFEDEERRRLENAERRAAERQRLRLRAVGDGPTRISGVVPDAVAARLATYLHAFTNPRLADGAVRGSADDANAHSGTQRGFGSPVSHPRRLAEAFGQLLETLDPARLPVHGGDATNVTVTISLDALRTGIGVATLGNGVPGDGFDTITAAQARRLACNARIIPAVLGAESEVLDLGRGSRLFSKAQRRALLLRDVTCRAQGCDIPGTWSEAHHLVPWSEGGASDLDNAALLCSHHHHRAHDAAYDLTRLANGDLRFHRRR
ncbi:HNH endonuclease signature motif containing protein [Nocardioides daphniae]|uniref:HNH endonuclease n=1 Tax=Nocardioides daphniae TaxID=402297 RepID=A0A4V1CW97_9ACTN|nr:HNH endonuclease signature motif containing protein [Nocardioides daphniae]QCC76507.1 HNH endonuclease [Nocardioides daphniae]GGD06056.1 HNH endonuclease [Nocardioides daphniae]